MKSSAYNKSPPWAAVDLDTVYVIQDAATIYWHEMEVHQFSIHYLLRYQRTHMLRWPPPPYMPDSMQHATQTHPFYRVGQNNLPKF